MKYVTSLVFAVTLVVGLMSCAGSKADKGAKAEAGALVIPAKTGNEKIDGFVIDSFKMLEDVEKMKNNLAELNAALKKINSHPVGPLEWMKEELMKGVSQTKSSLKAGVLVDPTAALRKKLDGMLENVEETLNALEAMLNRTETLLTTFVELPAEAGKMGLKAPKALKAIKGAGGAIKAVPGELKEVGAEGKKVMDNIQKLLSSI